MAQDIREATAGAPDRLLSFIQRIERLTEEKQSLTSDISEVFKEAKDNGFDVPTMRRIIALRKLDEEAVDLLDLYRSQVGLAAQLDMFHKEGGEVTVSMAPAA